MRGHRRGPAQAPLQKLQILEVLLVTARPCLKLGFCWGPWGEPGEAESELRGLAAHWPDAPSGVG